MSDRAAPQSDPSSERQSVHAIVSGRVQGVFYRAWAEEQARDLGITGWIRNRRDGTVELVAAGPADELAAFLDRCRQGPPAARVESVETRPCEYPPGPGFEQRSTV